LQPLNRTINSESYRYALGDAYDKALLFETLRERVYAVISALENFEYWHIS
jgi:hypothetical protein